MRSEGIDMINDDHMMIMSLAVTSTSVIAMVPFARTATTVTMMSSTTTVTSSMVTTTTATIHDVHREHVDEYDVPSHDRGGDK
ncbi:unnamed protein product [Camellia sinensis]